MKWIAGLALGLCATALPAQSLSTAALIERADSLLAWGRVFSAESLYYRAAARQPRDPATRLALGRYLGARGVYRVAAVLMEEALYFGGNADTISQHLAPMYAALGDWRALATLRGTRLSWSERARAEWLMRNTPEVDGPDSVFVPYSPADSVVGYVTMVVGTDTVDATIDPRVHGIVLDSSFRRRRNVRRFQSTREKDWRTATWVAPTIGFGEITLRNVPVRLEGTEGPAFARIGLDELGRLAPTFDPAGRQILLRRSGRVRRARGAAVTLDTVPTFARPEVLWLLRGDQVIPIDGVAAREMLRGTWTLNPRQGEIILGSTTGK
jgi:hypothetical protein